MKVLQIHNKYQNPGGEDVVVASEQQMLEAHGHTVFQWIAHNQTFEEASGLEKARIAVKSIWSFSSQQHMRDLLKDFQPDIVHVHNTIPLISSSIYVVCQQMNIPVVQTLHNYRLICVGSPLYRDAKTCEDCVGKLIPYPGIMHRCYRGSLVDSGVAAANLSFNRIRGTYKNDIDLYITLTEFSRQKFIKGGLPADKVVVKPNFISPNVTIGEHKGEYALFVGRLVPHKGIKTLIDAWRLLKGDIPLKILGKGPMESLLEENVPPGVEKVGHVSREEVLQLMQNARLLVFPSEWYEPFGMTIIEAMGTGLPVIASRIGSIPELVRDGETGWLFNPGDPADLARKVEEAWHSTEELSRRGETALRECQEKYTMKTNYELIMDIYQKAMGHLQ